MPLESEDQESDSEEEEEPASREQQLPRTQHRKMKCLDKGVKTVKI